jgi:NAD(P)-dependent dehydrogenase (short-subunit alcohol dehydrogenase family)
MNDSMTSKEKETQHRVAVITGSSSGIGLETSLLLARNNFLTYATMRTLQKADNLRALASKSKLPLQIIQLDVIDDASVKNAIQEIMADSGRVDVLVNNAGYGLSGAFEDITIDEIKRQFDTNLYGLIRTTQAVLPIMRKQKSGIIVNISSGAGLFGYPSGSAYISSKFAVEGLSESISYELEQFGIKIVLIEPGFIKTNFGSSMLIAKKSQDPNSVYSHLLKVVNAASSKMAQNASPPELVANAVLEAVTTDTPKLRYLVGRDIEQWVNSKNSKSDVEFHDMMVKDLF